MTLDKLAKLIKNAKEIVDDLKNKSEYWFYTQMAWDLADMQREIINQKNKEEQDK